VDEAASAVEGSVSGPVCCCYFKPKRGTDPCKQELLEHCLLSPSIHDAVAPGPRDYFPLTASGKIDRGALVGDQNGQRPPQASDAEVPDARKSKLSPNGGEYCTLKKLAWMMTL